MSLVVPLDGVLRVTSRFGVGRGSYRHGGIDLARSDGSVYRCPVKAPAAGRIAAVWTVDQPRGGFPYGNAAALLDQDGVVWRFMHFDQPPLLPVGASAAAGQTLGLCDSTGNSTGHHLHLDAAPGGAVDAATFRVAGKRIDPLRLYANSCARAAGYDAQVFQRQITLESGWRPDAVSSAGAEGVAQIIPRWHPAMRGRTFDPFASLAYAADLMAAHLDHRGGNYREALADYNTGRNSHGAFRAQGYRYADAILKGASMASTSELEALRADRDANHKEKMGALTQLGLVIEAANRAGAQAFHGGDWRAVKEAERFFHDPRGARTGAN